MTPFIMILRDMPATLVQVLSCTPVGTDHRIISAEKQIRGTY